MIREIHTVGPNPKEVVRIHSDQDTSFAGELADELLGTKVKQTHTGGHRPTNNSRTEKRIGLVLYSFRAMLYTATGGGRYYDQLWGPGLVHANKMVNYSTWSDGTSPYATRVGKPYTFSKHDHVFGAKCLYWEKKEHREVKWETAGKKGIWVGRSDVTPDAHLVVPYAFDAGSNRYVLGKVQTVARADVNDNEFPLRMGPNDVNDTKDFDEFMDAFHSQMYGQVKPEDMKEYQVDGEDPIWEVESIKGKRGKGRSLKYLVKWKDHDTQTWEPLKHLKGCMDAVRKYEESKKKGVGKYVYYNPEDPDSEHRRALEGLVESERVTGTVDEWLPGYKKELEEVKRRRLRVVSPDEMQVAVRQAVRIRMRLEPKKDGRKKGRLILQGFREPSHWDRDGTDSPTAALSTIRTLLFMAGRHDDVYSSIDVSTAFLQADAYGDDVPPQYDSVLSAL